MKSSIEPPKIEEMQSLRGCPPVAPDHTFQGTYFELVEAIGSDALETGNTGYTVFATLAGPDLRMEWQIWRHQAHYSNGVLTPPFASKGGDR